MREFLDLRLYEDWAKKYLGNDIGKAMPEGLGLPPLTRQVILEVSDPTVQLIRQRLCEFELRTRQRPYGSVNVARYYDPEDLADAEVLLLIITSLPEIYGGQWGTEYDESTACPRCCYGRRQVSPLILNTRTLPKTSDFAATITAGEWVVSERLADIIRAQEITGCQLRQVQHAGRKEERAKWYQLVVTETAGEAVPPTKFGIDYFNEDTKGDYVCLQHGHLGLNILTELFISRNTKPTTDIAATRSRYGSYAGWLVPNPFLLISPRFSKILKDNRIAGYELAVVHLV